MFCERMQSGLYGDARRRGNSDKCGPAASAMLPEQVRRCSFVAFDVFGAARLSVVPSAVVRPAVIAALLMLSCDSWFST